MRQGDSTDLLGPGGPRGSCIDMVYVALENDKQAVLTAILTQCKPDGKQLAVDLNSCPKLDNGEVYGRVYSQINTESQLDEVVSPNGTLVCNDRGVKTAYSISAQHKADPSPRIITSSGTKPNPKTTRVIPVSRIEAAFIPIVISELRAQPSRSNAALSTIRENTGMMTSVSAAGGVADAMADHVASGRGDLPPTANAPGGPGGGSGGVGGSRRRTRQQLAILLGVLTILLIGGITTAVLPGGFSNLPHIIPGTTATATVTITPDSKDVSNTFLILAVTDTPNPSKRQVSAHILIATSPTQSKTVTTASVVQQSDIDGAANSLAASLTPGTLSALQKQVQPNEQVVPNTLKCYKSTFTANHKAGDYATSVTVTVAITCEEEVYDHQAALAMAANLLTKQASLNPGPAYALTGNIVTSVMKASLVDSKGTVALFVSAEGLWVYQFSQAVLQGFINNIANKSNQEAVQYLMNQPGVSAVKIDNPNGNTLPDAAHIKIEIESIPGATGTPTTGTPTSGTQTISPTVLFVALTRAATPVLAT